MLDDPDRCYAALRARDPRFDGWFFVGVTSTGIYCRPSCPARTAARRNVRFHATAASAQQAGFRACKRCRPDATPGSPAWDQRADLVGRAMRLIADGVVDRDGVDGLARRLGYSSRHLHRQLVAEVGAGPLALARAQRAQTARTLIETTGLAFADVAFAAGFASVRQFNDTVRGVFAATPTVLRAAAVRGEAPAADTIVLRLPYRAPLAVAPLLDHLATRAIEGVEERRDDGHRRSLTLPHGAGVATLVPDDGAVRATLVLDDLRDLTVAVQRLRRLLDLDADPLAIDDHLGADPGLAPSVRDRPGLRLPGAVDGTELVVRAVLGQQVSVAGAATLAGRLVARHGPSLRHPVGAVTRRFPDADALADADLDGLGLTAARAEAVRAVAAATAAGDLDLEPGADRAEARGQLLAIPGIGPWTADYVALRALHDPDAFPATDLVLRRAAGAAGTPGTAHGLERHAERWRPWRGYAAQHLWTLATTSSDPPSTTAPTSTAA
jgi:AraC family transcriptional regulator, regulatory protein of adaptative response / DNA-3-methyladenine glycosylase II